MNASIGEILGYFGTFVVGGGLMTLVNLKSNKKQKDVEVKVDEIKAIHDTVEMVYKPIIDNQNQRIKELEVEVKSLRQQLIQERSDHQREMDIMNKRILNIASALGIKAHSQIRDDKGRFVKADETAD